MAKRRSPARRRGTRRSRKREVSPLWLVLPVVVLLAAPRVLDVTTSAWTTLLAAVAGLAVLSAAAVVAARRMGAAYRRDALRRAQLDRLDPRRFEELAAELLRRDGFRGVRVVGGAGDRGVDVVGVAPDGRSYAIQCKYYTRAVGPGSVRDFVGALQARPYQGHRGVLVTSDRLSAQAAATAREHDMVVVDRDLLADWLLGAYHLGSRRRSSPAWLVRLRRGRAAREHPEPEPLP
ncbi:restriction system protein [Streptosporangium becharense]|uniref:Restriction system protein n=1 Tax=Streptosporangium becharense TaxID=1816182 RepID=A0A7W9MFB8_9ACTN|nr:restriction endonuclease [Streptosporangium becharense]MBB2912088.1 restriction system protein [Streptosporangium becharense]MBB5818635.1 restriction system protein [Streptosporangium becharense]